MSKEAPRINVGLRPQEVRVIDPTSRLINHLERERKKQPGKLRRVIEVIRGKR